MDKRLRVLINFVAFQLGWFALVIGAARDWVWQGVLVALAVMALHLYLSARPWRELQLLVLVLLLGTAWDSVLSARGIIVYPTGVYPTSRWFALLAPLWIIVMWGLFATTLNVSLLWLRRRAMVAAAFGAVGAPLSFLAGMRLQALHFPSLRLGMLCLALGWALLMPLLIYLAERFDGVNAK